MTREELKEKLNEYFKAHENDVIRDVSRLVAIKSDKEEAKPGMPYGEGPAAAVAEALEIIKEHGFRATNYDNYVCTADLNDGPQCLDILAHLDVVPVSDSWTVTK
ncbi:MAG: peptidase M20, partial [Firmicutes bacterium]|nr:peptidase M20 [Bacillota bacterium]